jgi:hypothetical protein
MPNFSKNIFSPNSLNIFISQQLIFIEHIQRLYNLSRCSSNLSSLVLLLQEVSSLRFSPSLLHVPSSSYLLYPNFIYSPLVWAFHQQWIRSTVLISVLAVPNPQLSRRATCSADNQNYVDNLVCPTINAVSGFLNYQGDSLGFESLQ